MMDLGLLVLRVCLGLMFMAHGAQQAFGAFGGPGIGGFAKMLGGIGFTHATLWAMIAAYTELLGGLYVILGLGTRIASVLLLIFICVAAIKVHITKGFFLMQGGFEYTFIIASICVALILCGPGKFAITK